MCSSRHVLRYDFNTIVEINLTEKGEGFLF